MNGTGRIETLHFLAGQKGQLRHNNLHRGYVSANVYYKVSKQAS